MNSADLIAQAQRILDLSNTDPMRSLSEAREFFRVHVGERSCFYTDVVSLDVKHGMSSNTLQRLRANLQAFVAHGENQLLAGVSPERRAQIDVVSDFLEQAHQLLENNDMHPAASAMIIGSALEEFLRNWVEAEGLELGPRKASIDSYCNTLRAAELIEKQDVKDVTSWAGLRNDAAHGVWEAVSDRAHINLMLMGVNLFMRKYGPQ